MPVARFNQASSFHQIKAYSQTLKGKHLSEMFAGDPKRGQALSVRTPHLFLDYSRQRVDLKTMQMLEKLADERKLGSRIKAMTTGQKINETEDRAVLHLALRDPEGKLVIPAQIEDAVVRAEAGEVKEVLSHIESFSKEIISGKRTGKNGKPIKNIVAVGIGGSYLGPEYLANSLRPFAQDGMNLRFVANVDGADFVEKTQDLDLEETLVIIVSKTFTTAETMKNATTAKEWIKTAIDRHFVAVSTAAEKVDAFGINTENMFGFWNWVGGRYSASSAVGILPLALYLGFDNAKKILDGAHWMDKHFVESPFMSNIPILSAMLDIWNINFMGFKTRALLPYSQGVGRLPAHTQQVEMESNGKRVLMDGTPVDFDTGEVVFGEPGTNGQHSFYQLIHQGTQIIPCDFIGFINPQYPLGKATAKEVTHHQELMTNFLAQADALAFGKKSDNPHKHFPGNRPSSSLLLKQLDPFTAGLLLAWTEHRAAVKGFIWGINSFDQYGVELGKILGADHRGRMLQFNDTGVINVDGLNPSTAALLTAFLKGGLPK
ncbi:MAG: glucose-6-phosphate isomerase [Candidatus Saganbacteria bacterium]|nr:glucose-6-phosphate isomerase [Candidatus Saganbacteria bacterium]